jgi:hypothetical protein
MSSPYSTWTMRLCNRPAWRCWIDTARGSQEAVASVPRPWCQTPRLKAPQVLDAEQPELRTPTVADRPCADAHLPRPVGLGILPFWVVWAGIEWPFTSSAGAPTLFP